MNLLQILAIPLSLLYGCLMKLRRQLYLKDFLTSHQLPGVCISIGNLEVGGTGKTPVCIALANELLSKGHRPAILTRGYRSGLNSEESVVLLNETVLYPSNFSKAFFADEARLQSHHLPTVAIIIGANRVQAAQKYCQAFEPPTHWILSLIHI